MEEYNQYAETIKVELIGGPLCGLVTDWPEHTPTLVFAKSNARYEFEGLNNKRNTAIYRGWVDS